VGASAIPGERDFPEVTRCPDSSIRRDFKKAVQERIRGSRKE